MTVLAADRPTQYREGIERDKRSQSIIEDELKRYKTDLADQMRIVESDTFQSAMGPKNARMSFKTVVLSWLSV